MANTLLGENINNPLSNYGNIDVGLPKFITNVVTIIFVGAGLFAFFNLIIAGISYIGAAGDTKKIEAATYSINMSLMGLVVMVAAAAVTGIVSYLLFGNASAILSPNITGPGSF
ncbi:MAG: hypothetical protein ABII21_03895 [bacterium]